MNTGVGADTVWKRCERVRQRRLDGATLSSRAGAPAVSKAHYRKQSVCGVPDEVRPNAAPLGLLSGAYPGIGLGVQDT